MMEVSCRAFGLAFDGLKAKGIPIEKLVNGLPIGREVLEDENQRVDWDLFVRVCERLEELLGGPKALVALGRENFHSSSSFGFMRKVASVFMRPRDLYWMGTNWFGRSLFTNVDGSFEDLDDGRVRETLKIADGYRDCPQLFHIMRGGLVSAPRLLNHPDAEVEMELGPGQAVYTITPPGQARFRSSPVAMLTSRYAAWGLIDAMSHEQRELNRNLAEMNGELHEAVGILEELRKATVVGREIATHVHPGDFAQALEKALGQHIPNRGVALWIEPIDGESTNLLYTRLEGSEAPTRTYQLANGPRRVGRLEIWDSERKLEPDLLDELLPWIALGLDNVRANAALTPKPGDD
jgi:hypothetical protein